MANQIEQVYSLLNFDTDRFLQDYGSGNLTWTNTAEDAEKTIDQSDFYSNDASFNSNQAGNPATLVAKNIIFTNEDNVILEAVVKLTSRLKFGRLFNLHIDDDTIENKLPQIFNLSSKNNPDEYGDYNGNSIESTIPLNDWVRITVSLNNPKDNSNGYVSIYINGTKIIDINQEDNTPLFLTNTKYELILGRGISSDSSDDATDNAAKYYIDSFRIINPEIQLYTTNFKSSLILGKFVGTIVETTNTDTYLDIKRTLYQNPRDITPISVFRTVDDTIYDAMNNEWVNNQHIVSVAKNQGNVFTDAIYFPGAKAQALILDYNILYGLDEFTIATWVKTLENNAIPTTFVEIVPKVLFDYDPVIDGELPDDLMELIDSYKNQLSSQTDIVNFNIFKKDNTYELSTRLDTLDQFDKTEWNHVALTYKDGIFYLFVNGHLVNKDTSHRSDPYYSLLSKDMYTVIGASFIDDITSNDPNSMLMDDLIIYNKALFTEDYVIPTIPLDINYGNQGVLYDLKRSVARKTVVKFDTLRFRNDKVTTLTRTRRLTVQKQKIVILKFGF